jgi:hypothetical protein
MLPWLGLNVFEVNKHVLGCRIRGTQQHLIDSIFSRHFINGRMSAAIYKSMHSVKSEQMVMAKLALVALPKVFDGVTVVRLVAYIQVLTVPGN